MEEKPKYRYAYNLAGAALVNLGKNSVAAKYFRKPRGEHNPDALNELTGLRRGLETASPITVDKVQRAPEILLAIKQAVDTKRRPGNFLLKGSANLTLVDAVSESRAGLAGGDG